MPRFLETAAESPGNPALSSEVMDRIRSGAHRLPLYLDLSVTLARGEASKTAEGTLTPLPSAVHCRS